MSNFEEQFSAEQIENQLRQGAPLPGEQPVTPNEQVVWMLEQFYAAEATHEQRLAQRVQTRFQARVQQHAASPGAGKQVSRLRFARPARWFSPHILSPQSRQASRGVSLSGAVLLVLLLVGSWALIFAQRPGPIATHPASSTPTHSASPTPTSSTNSSATTETRRFDLGSSTSASLTLTDPVGAVTLHPGSQANQVLVTITKRDFSHPEHIQVISSQQGAHVSLEVQIPSSLLNTFQRGKVDLDVALPSLSDIQATANGGSITIDGVSGQMHIKADAGSVNFQGGTVKGQSSFEANAGSIKFDGALAANGDYTFTAPAGSINLTFPPDSSFTLDATANAGSVHNAFGSNTVGSHPTSQVHAYADAGSINIDISR